MSPRFLATRGGRTVGLVTALLVAAIALLFAGSLSATATPPAARPLAAATTPAPYPPVFCPTIAVSTTRPYPGETIAITGQGFDGVQSLTLTLTPGDYVLGHVTTTSAGTFSTHVTLPAGVTGNRVIHAEGSGSDCPVDPIQILVSSGTTPPGHPLPFTGVDILGALVIALALIGIGVLLSRGGRRRYQGVHARH